MAIAGMIHNLPWQSFLLPCLERNAAAVRFAAVRVKSMENMPAIAQRQKGKEGLHRSSSRIIERITPVSFNMSPFEKKVLAK